MNVEPNNIYLGDCLDLMTGIADESIDAIICDLPYQVLHKDNPNAQWDRMIPFQPLWAQYERIIKPNGAIILFAQGMFTSDLMQSNRKLWRYNLIWDKGRGTGFLNANRMPMRCHEDICVFYKQLPVYNPQMGIGEPNHSQGKLEHPRTNNCYGQFKTGRTYDYDKQIRKVAPTRPNEKFPQSIIHIQKEHETTVFHPTQKPVDLLRYLIRTYSQMGGVFLKILTNGNPVVRYWNQLQTAIQRRKSTITGTSCTQTRHIGKGKRGFSSSSSSDGLTDEQEHEIAENIYDWWISGMSYKRWYAERFLQYELEFDGYL